MLTIPASAPTAPFMRSASSRTRTSASGSKALMSIGLVEIALQDQRGGERIDIRSPRGARARLAQGGLSGGRRQRLVDEVDRPGVARREPAREFRGELRDRVLGSVGMARAPDDERRRLPFAPQLFDPNEARSVGGGFR